MEYLIVQRYEGFFGYQAYSYDTFMGISYLYDEEVIYGDQNRKVNL